MVATVVAFVLLAGCLSFNGGAYDVHGEKIGAGVCRQAGIVEISIEEFYALPNATISVRFHNQWKGNLGGTLISIGITGNDGIEKVYNNANWEKPRVHDWLEAGENATVIWKIPNFPPAPWKQIVYPYAYGGKNPTYLYCSLEGDNAPLAFETRRS
jgi:hypothetical protein